MSRDNGGVRGLTGFAVALAMLVLAPTAFATSPGQAKVVNRVSANAGESVKLFASRDFKVTGTCEDNGGGDVTANTFLAARRDNLSYFAYGPANGSDRSDVDFDRSDGKFDFIAIDATGMVPVIEAAEYHDFYGEGRRGRVLQGRVATSVHVKGSDCNFGGVFFGSADSGPVHTNRVTADAGGTVTLFANKDFRLTGRCEDNGGGDFTANTFLSAKRLNLIYYLTDLDQVDTDFDPADGAIDLFFTDYDAGGTVAEYVASTFDDDFFAEGRGGAVLQGRVGTGVHIRGADCMFSGVFVGPASAGPLHVVKGLKAHASQRLTLFANDDFKVIGSCVDNGGGDFTADTLLVAKRENLLYYAYDDGSDVDFDPSDGEIDFTGYDATGTSPDYASEDDYSDFYGEGKGGQVLAGRVGTGVHIRGADCTFSGIFTG